MKSEDLRRSSIRFGVTVVLAMVVVLPSWAGSLEEQLALHLYSPEAIMRHSREIDLTPDQREAVSKAVRSAQHEIMDLQWEVEDVAADLIESLAQSDADDAQVMARLDDVLAAENMIKRRHILLLLEIRHLLTVEQRASLREFSVTDWR